MRGIDFTPGKVCNWDPRLWLLEVIEANYGLGGQVIREIGWELVLGDY